MRIRITTSNLSWFSKKTNESAKKRQLQNWHSIRFGRWVGTRLEQALRMLASSLRKSRNTVLLEMNHQNRGTGTVYLPLWWIFLAQMKGQQIPTWVNCPSVEYIASNPRVHRLWGFLYIKLPAYVPRAFPRIIIAFGRKWSLHDLLAITRPRNEETS